MKVMSWWNRFKIIVVRDDGDDEVDDEAAEYDEMIREAHRRAFAMITSMVEHSSGSESDNPYTMDAIDMAYENESQPEALALVLAGIVTHYVNTIAEATEVDPMEFWQEWITNNLEYIYGE
jgi:hypothetical protein